MPEQLMGLTDNRQCLPVTGAPSEPRLEISASVGNGGRNLPPDVEKIQRALNRVPMDEGGPAPPLIVDGLVGPKTVGAIYTFQRHQFGTAKADGRVDPNQYTIEKLREFQTDSLPGVPAGTDTLFGFSSRSQLKSDPASVMLRVKGALPIALQWSLAARRRLAEAIGFAKGQATGGDFKRSHDLVHRCFKIKTLSAENAVKAMRKIDGIFEEMPKVIFADNVGKGIFYRAPAGGCRTAGRKINAFTFPGGFRKVDRTTGLPPMSHPEFSGPNVSQRGIYMCTVSIASKDPFNMADLIVHEMAHFVGPAKGFHRIQDHSGGLDALNSNHITAIRTASNYAWLAWLARLPKSQWMTNTG